MILFRLLIGMWVVGAQVFGIATLMRLLLTTKPFNIAISLFVYDLGACLIWPMLLFTGRGRVHVLRLLQFK